MLKNKKLADKSVKDILQQEYLRVSEIAYLLQSSSRQIHRIIEDENINFIIIGNKKMLKKEDFYKMEKALTRKSTTTVFRRVTIKKTFLK